MNPWLFLMLGLFAIGATAQGPTVWDERESEWVSLSEFSRRYASLGPGALRLSQVGPVVPTFNADLRLLPDPPRLTPQQRYIEIPRSPVLINGRVFEGHHK